MTYNVEFSSQFEKSIKKLKKKDKTLYNQIQKKLIDIVQNPERYKTLGNVFAGYRQLFWSICSYLQNRKKCS